MKSFIPTLAVRSRFPGIVLLWAAIALEGMAALLWLLRIPSEPGAALWLGFSPLRMLLAGGVLAMVLFFAGLALAAVNRSYVWQRLTHRTDRLTASPERTYTLLTVLFFLFVAVLALLIVMVSPAGVHSNVLVVLLDRAGMVIVWIDLALAQLGLWVSFNLFRQIQSEKGSASRLPHPLWGTFLVVAAVVTGVAMRSTFGLMETQSAWLNQVSLFLAFGAPLAWVVVQLVNHREVAWVFNFWAGVLFFGGALVWVWFIQYGEGPFAFHDWAEISIPRLTVVQNAIRQGELPLHISVGPALLGFTDRYMGVPDLLLAPQVLLLKWMEMGPFLMTHLILTYLAGFVGLVVFARRYRLSVIAFSILFLLFNFNGHIAAHIAVGHFIWTTAYFLLPWLTLLIFRLFDGPTGWKWVLQTAALLFVILLHGGYHYLVYALFLLALIAVVVPRHFWLLVKTITFSVLLCAVRLFPLVINVDTFNENIGYLDGFRSVLRIVESLIHVSLPNFTTEFTGVTERIGSWELTYYLGLIGAVLLVIFGIVAVYRNKQNPQRILLLPALGMLLLSFDGVYRNLLALLPVPPITGERVASRFFLLAFLIILALAAIEFQRWYEKQKPSLLLHAGWVAACLLLAHDLWQNLLYWQVRHTARVFPYEILDPTKLIVANHPDPEYLTALWVGAAVSLASLAALIFFSTREKQPSTIDRLDRP